MRLAETRTRAPCRRTDPAQATEPDTVMSIRRATLPALACLVFAASCGSTKEAKSQELDQGRWLAPSLLLKQQLDDEAARLPYTRGIERIEQIRWFASIGEPAYETLLEMIADPREEVASAAFAALGATGDRRLVDPLREADWQADTRGSDLKLERARTMVRLGDWSEIPTLISGLEDERVYVRGLAIEALAEATGETLSFDARSDSTSREIAVDRWERWWLKYSGDPLR